MLTFFEEALPLISLKIIFEKFNIILRGCRGDSPDYKGEQTVRSLRAKKSNYNLKSRGFSFLETIITVSIALIISFILFGLIFSMNKSFVKISENLKKEKEIENFKNILSSHIEYNESVEFRILNASSDYSIPKFKEIFKLEQANQKIKGNFLILKFTRISDIKNKEVEINYRTFFFVDKKLKISYFIEGDIGTHGGFISQTKIVEKCEGSFEGENNLLKVFIENLDKGEKNYEFLLSF
ncbi:MAG: hypothetical protein KGV57_05125 [Fusobacterium sp.]|nr:hypothetical protein [Fusobacterium sp.]